MQSLIYKVRKFLRSEDGPTAAEYAVMLGMILMVVMATVYTIGLNTNTSFSNSSSSVSSAITSN